MQRSGVKRGCFLGTKHPLVWQEHCCERKLWDQSVEMVPGEWEKEDFGY